MSHELNSKTPALRIGTGGWSYPERRRGFYAGVPRRRWLKAGVGVHVCFDDTAEGHAAADAIRLLAVVGGVRD